LLQTKITAANISDKEGAIKLLNNKKQKGLKKIWGDSAYQGQDLQNIFFNHGIELEVVKRPPGRRRIYNEQWRAEWVPVKRTFGVLPKRWVVERTFAWMGRNRRLSKDYEYLPEISEAYLYMAMSKTILGRLKFAF
jgi:putative transposase